MGKVIANLSMSLDGFVSGPNDGIELGLGEGGERLFNWYFSGETEFKMPGSEMVFKTSEASARHVRTALSRMGALVTGRRTFDITNGWNGRHTMDVPVFVVTHSVPREWVKTYPDAPFTFVLDGVESAVEKARQAAGAKHVALGSAAIIQQCIRAGLVDELAIDLAPCLLGGGVRLFEHLGDKPLDLVCLEVITTPSVTHLTYRILK
jgi:dihydrofolate reductase